MGKLPGPSMTAAGNQPSTPVANNAVRQDRRHITSKRKQTLLTLLDALNELQKEDDLGTAHSSNHKRNYQRESELEPPKVDDHIQQAGANLFNAFQRRVELLDGKLRTFSNNARPLGSSIAILSSCQQLRNRLAQVLFLFRENAADLFPRRVTRQNQEAIQPPNMVPRKARRKRKAAHAARPTVVVRLDPEDFPHQMDSFAQDVIIFHKSLSEFPEFTDEALQISVSLFVGDLKYWGSCLKTYKGQFRYPAVQRYLHDLSSEMAEHLDTLTTSLGEFLETGIPLIKHAQKHAADQLLNLTTTATFFSAVTATTLQYSYQLINTPLANSVNGFWFCSLVFSIASAVNSLLGLTWKQAMYRSPKNRVPWWVLIWIKRSPLIFLVVSVAAFSVGLCLFVYASTQHPVTAALTTIFTCFSSFGLLAVSAWFCFERVVYFRHAGTKWLMDVLSDINKKWNEVPAVKWVREVPPQSIQRVGTWGGGHVRRASMSISRVSTQVGSILSLKETNAQNDTVVELNDAADTGSPTVAQILRSDSQGMAITASPPASPELQAAYSEHPSAIMSTASLASDSLSTSNPDSTDSGVETPGGSRPAKRLVGVVKQVMLMRSVQQGGPFTLPSARKQSAMKAAAERPLMNTMRIATLVPLLRSLQPTQRLDNHTALVRHLQFSPDGKYLATSSWDRTCSIFKVNDDFSVHRTLAHYQGFVNQVAWSPAGNLLLTKMLRGVKVWTAEEGVCKKTIKRPCEVQSVAWCPGGEAFMSVEESEVVKVDLTGKVLDHYKFERMKVHDVGVTADSQRLLCVATLQASADNLRPRLARAEKQIIVYNLDRKAIENQVPVLHEVRDITLARTANVALVSYENQAPPQLWRIEMVKHRDNEHPLARLNLVTTYAPKVAADFAGPSYFGGKNDQLVLCAGKAGDMHIWERETGQLLHEFRAQDHDVDLTCLAWNHASDTHMFATGTHDGTVQIWTTSSDRHLKVPHSEHFSGSTPSTPRTITPPNIILENSERSESPLPHDDFDFAGLELERPGSSERTSESSRPLVVYFNGGTSSASRR